MFKETQYKSWFKFFRPRERAFKQFKCPRPQCVNVVNFRDLQTWMHINIQLPGYHGEFFHDKQTDPEVIWKTMRRTLKVLRHYKLLFLTKQWQTEEQTGFSIIWSDFVRQGQSARWNLPLKLRLACLKNIQLSCYSAMPLSILFSS